MPSLCFDLPTIFFWILFPICYLLMRYSSSITSCICLFGLSSTICCSWFSYLNSTLATLYLWMFSLRLPTKYVVAWISDSQFSNNSMRSSWFYGLPSIAFIIAWHLIQDKMSWASPGLNVEHLEQLSIRDINCYILCITSSRMVFSLPGNGLHLILRIDITSYKSGIVASTNRNSKSCLEWG